MTTLSPQTPLGQLVAQRPARSRILDQLQIDYCCGGKQSLAQACTAKGLDPDTVLHMLHAFDAAHRTPEPETDWTRASLTELADHIEQTHHEYLRRELPRLQAMVRKVTAVHGPNHPSLLELEGVFAAFVGELESHTMKEEQLVFPMIRQIDAGELPAANHCGGSLEEPIRAMESEHDDAGQALARINHLTNGYTPPDGACNTFVATLDALRELEADMHRHVHKENHILFPRAAEREQQLKAAPDGTDGPPGTA